MRGLAYLRCIISFANVAELILLSPAVPVLSHSI